MTTTENSIFPYFWKDMSNEEKREYHDILQNRIIEHRYRYYVLCDTVLDDFEYDHLEKLLSAVAEALGLPHKPGEKGTYNSVFDMVDFDITRPGAQEAADRVIAKTTYWDTQQTALEEVWKRIDPPKWVLKQKEKKDDREKERETKEGNHGTQSGDGSGE
jgi:hypothetical protein